MVFGGPMMANRLTEFYCGKVLAKGHLCTLSQLELNSQPIKKKEFNSQPFLGGNLRQYLEVQFSLLFEQIKN